VIAFWLLLASLEAQRLTRLVAESGQVLEIAEPVSHRLNPVERIAPGAAPLFSFRYFEGNEKHRFGQLDLVMDDAGH
jgi:hypothetical protein